jgi:hypothetical protein
MITDEEWLAFMDDLQQTLDKFGAAGVGRSESDRGEHTGGDRDCSTADVKGYAIGSC